MGCHAVVYESALEFWLVQLVTSYTLSLSKREGVLVQVVVRRFYG